MKRVYGSHQIEEAIRPYLRKKDWVPIDCRITHFDAYQSLCGSNEADKVTQMLDPLISTVLEKMGASGDVLGSGDANY